MSTAIPNAIYRVKTAPMNLIYQVWHWCSLGIHPQAARTMVVLLLPNYFPNLHHLQTAHKPNLPSEENCMRKKHIPSLLFAPGLALVLISLIVWQLIPSDKGVVQAALPPGHPPVAASYDYGGGAVVSATLRDLFLPGTQPNQLEDNIAAPASCRGCHAGYSSELTQTAEYEPWTAWAGSMMAQSGRDPVFFAALDVANADFPLAGEFCLRCHMPRGWLNGRSTAVDGSTMDEIDEEGIQCALCHRMVDPDYTPGEDPERDLAVHETITTPVTSPGNAALTIDPEDYRRGPYDVVADLDGLDPHLAFGAQDTLQSPYHREAAFCGTCHDIDNPLLSWDEESQSYLPNETDTPAGDDDLFPIERTYSEWLLSDFNSEAGIYAPQFGGNKNYVSTCQDCHMRDVTGKSAAFFGNTTIVPERNDMGLHDLTGANTWVPQIIPLHPAYSNTFSVDPERQQAVISGTIRARYMLQNAALMNVTWQDDQLIVTVINNAGHKLPTGYVEGRRMWLQVEGYDINHTLVYTSGAYDVATATLFGYGTDETLKVYESHHGLTQAWADQLGLPAGKSFHFVLNNEIVFDNRIPPRGYNFEAFNAAELLPMMTVCQTQTVTPTGNSGM